MDDLDNMIGKIAPGSIKLSYSGQYAVKTSTGYKSYNIETGKLTNCSNFVLDGIGDMFFSIPTTKVKKGDIIVLKGKGLRCVVDVNDKEITVINYENSTKEVIIPERHIFFGSTYFYGKVVSPFGNSLRGKGGSSGKYLKMMALSSLFGGKGNTGDTNNNSMLQMMLLMQKPGDDIFGGIFDDFDDIGDEEDESKEAPDKK